MNNYLLQQYLNQTLGNGVQASSNDSNNLWAQLAQAKDPSRSLAMDPNSTPAPNSQLKKMYFEGIDPLDVLGKGSPNDPAPRSVLSDTPLTALNLKDKSTAEPESLASVLWRLKAMQSVPSPQNNAVIQKTPTAPSPTPQPSPQGGQPGVPNQPSLQRNQPQMIGQPNPTLTGSPSGFPSGSVLGSPSGPLNGILNSDPAIKQALIQKATQHPEAMNPAMLQAIKKLAEQNSPTQTQGETNEYTPFKNMDLSPLMAYSDSISPGGKLLQGYNRPLNPNELKQQQLANQGKLVDMQYKLGKLDVEQYKAQVLALAAANKATQIDPITKMAMGQAYISHNQMLNKIATDPQLQTFSKNARGLTDAINQIEWSAIETPQQIHEAQKKILAALSLTGNYSADERKLMDISSMGINFDYLKQFLYGEPQDAGAGAQEWVKHLKELAQIQIQNYRNHAEAELNNITTGAEFNYSVMPQLKTDLDNRKKAYLNQFEPNVLSPPNPKGEFNQLKKQINRSDLREEFEQFKRKSQQPKK